jgi:hypothetical protein
VQIVNGLGRYTDERTAHDLIRRGRAMKDAAGRLVLLDHETVERIEAQARRNRQDAVLDEVAQRGQLLTWREARRLPIIDFATAIGQGKNTGARARR